MDKEAKIKELGEKVRSCFYDPAPFDVLIQTIVDLMEEAEDLKAEIHDMKFPGR